jgi:hypothetical protein
VIEMLRNYADSKTLALMFRWQGMTIFLDGTLQPDGKRYLLLTTENAGTAGLTVDGRTARWIIYGPDAQKSDAFVCTISDGPASAATGKGTCR